MVSAEDAASISSSLRREFVHRQIASAGSVIHSYIVARLEASRSGDFQSPFVIKWAISNRPSLVHVIPAPKITPAFSNSWGDSSITLTSIAPGLRE
jgi:hypothetical protein